jgi:hypothetical protein
LRVCPREHGQYGRCRARVRIRTDLREPHQGDVVRKLTYVEFVGALAIDQNDHRLESLHCSIAQACAYGNAVSRHARAEVEVDIELWTPRKDKPANRCDPTNYKHAKPLKGF